MSFSRCGRSDTPQLRELAVSTFVVQFGKDNTQADMDSYITEAFDSMRVESELQDENVHYYFVHQEGELAGYLKLNLREAQTDIKENDALEIERIYIISKFQGMGLGKCCVEKARQFAADNGIRYIWLGVWERNEGAIRFYRKHGFEVFDKHTFLLGTDEQTDLLMKLELD